MQDMKNNYPCCGGVGYFQDHPLRRIIKPKTSGGEQTMNNKGPWKVTCQMLGDTMKYAVVRIIDVTKTEHNGNREYTDHGYMESRDEAVAIADQLNEAEKE